MAIMLEDRPRVIYGRNPLKVVVAQLRFPPIFALEQPAGVAPLQDAIREAYPLAEAGQQITLTVAPGGVPPVSQPLWRFLSADKAWIVAVAADSVSLETTAYERFRQFRERIEPLLRATTTILRIQRRERLGLRYVNEIVHPDAQTVTEWKRFLQEDLVGIAGGERLRDRVTQAIQQIQVELDGAKLTIRHGYVRPGGTGSVYLIDLDAYDDQSQPFDVDHTLSQMGQFNLWIWNFFRGSITDELNEYLQPRPAGD